VKNTDLWAQQQQDWRQPQDVISQWKSSTDFSSDILRCKITGQFKNILESLGITLLVGREYEHLLLALSVVKGRLVTSYLQLPHPSGIAVNRKNNTVHFASTRNPNQVFTFGVVNHFEPRNDFKRQPVALKETLVPISSQFYPGSLYLHDLAIINDKLYGNAVAHNAIVELKDQGQWQRVWWPKSIDHKKDLLFQKNFIQLNSIAAGKTLKSSYFSASTDKPGHRRPGQLNFPVDKRGVIFSGATREPIAYGLTRPHSARLHKGKLWVANSGYGQVGFIENGAFQSVCDFGSWTRGLNFFGNYALVGTSRVLPRFSHYAPGLDVKKAECGFHFLNYTTGKIEGSILWPQGNQIFAVDWLDSNICKGFPFISGQKNTKQLEKDLFYSFKLKQRKKD